MQNVESEIFFFFFENKNQTKKETLPTKKLDTVSF